MFLLSCLLIGPFLGVIWLDVVSAEWTDPQHSAVKLPCIMGNSLAVIWPQICCWWWKHLELIHQRWKQLRSGFITWNQPSGVLHHMTWPPWSPDLNPAEMVGMKLTESVESFNKENIFHYITQMFCFIVWCSLKINKIIKTVKGEDVSKLWLVQSGFCSRFSACCVNYQCKQMVLI